ncbi:hypothetical protein [Candidatus Mycolicibacterium alkanivorans]|uniref:ESX-1 secretion-associated protein n=1 Tax=Candidatus Mycolicibacterium alkanivorans TaxID=2954114 RepID=A0ABS9YW68_9MYCO|nr:hypothetical protein [Candidatus Mycolicibacterium alkanivorans]MCI4675478.1 hypothetical protein [Candidatus Mycolicibacterium alkanivorans]
MPEPVGLDASALSRLTERVAQAGAELSAMSIPGVEQLPGSALAGLAGPRRAAADVRRHGTTVQAWADTARRMAGELSAADQAGADRVGLR